jgi:hypothetical protein
MTDRLAVNMRAIEHDLASARNEGRRRVANLVRDASASPPGSRQSKPRRARNG